jgi:hypothetical protein
MTFENIHSDIECDCLKGADVDTESHFGRKVNNPELKLKDFNSKWDKDTKNRPVGNCAEICSFKGISLSIMNEEHKPKVIDIFKQLFPISPSYKPHLCVIQLGTNSGMVKPTPLENNPYHYDLYKADEFAFEEIKQVEFISLAEDV